MRTLGTTPTQAILSYAVEEETPCRLEVSESPSYSPLVHDVDPRLFADADSDTRAGNLSTGSERLFIIGKRTSALAADGRQYSRALQANTMHYYRLTCGVEVATGSFFTNNIPLGKTYGEPLPADPEHPGQYAWPTFDGARRFSLPGYVSREQHVDPVTGALVRRITVPGEVPDNSLPNQKFAMVRQLDGGVDWQNAETVKADDNYAASFSGTGSNWLLLRPKPIDFGGGWSAYYDSASLDYIQVMLKASGSAAAPEDRTLEVCLTLDGISCASLMRELVLANEEARYSIPAEPVSMYADWTASGREAIGRAAVVARSGVVSTADDPGGSTVTWSGGAYFNTQWGAGSRITIQGSEYTVASVESPRRLRLVENAGTQAAAAFSAFNFGVLVRKKTSSTDPIALQYAGYSIAISQMPVWPASGSVEMCAQTPVSDANGNSGYYCAIIYSGQGRHLYWIDRTTAESRYLGFIGLPARSGPDGYTGTICTAAGATFDPNDPHVFYCDAFSNDSQWKRLILKVTYRNSQNTAQLISGTIPDCSTNQNQEPCFSVTNLTPQSQGKDIAALIRLFDPAFDGNYFGSSCMLLGLQGSYLFLECNSGTQDSLGWVAVYDLTKDLSRLSAGNAFSYGNNPIVAATDYFSKPTRRWCQIHSSGQLRESSNLVVIASAKTAAENASSSIKGHGPWRVKVLSGDLSLNFQPCPANPVDPALERQNQCSTIAVDGEPCDPSPDVVTSGTISVNSGSNLITGTDSGWSQPLTGADIFIAGVKYRFTYGGNGTTGLLDRPYEGATASGLTYEIQRESRNCKTPGREAEHYLQDAAPGDVLAINDSERVRLLKKNPGNQWVLQRGYRQGVFPARDYSGTAPVWLYCQCDTWNRDLRFDTIPGWWWDFRLDPHGSGAGSRIDPQPISHGVSSVTLTVGDTPFTNCFYPTYTTCYAARTPVHTLDDLSQAFKINANPAFSGKVGLGYLNTVESHVSWQQTRAHTGEQRWFADMRPFLTGPAGVDNPLAERIPGTSQLYRISTNVNHTPLALYRKHLATLAFCGKNVLLDISSPATGDVLADGAGGAYQYCVSNRTGECRAGSRPGEIYVNCPYAHPTGYSAVTCNGGNNDNDICIANNSSNVSALSQFGVYGDDLKGRYQRVLSQTFQKYRRYDIFWNAQVLPDASWILVRTGWLWEGRSDVLAIKAPPFPQPDEIDRSGFIPIPLVIQPPADADIDNVVVEFGYDENFYCTSRREACVAATPAIQPEAPFYFAGETYKGLACYESCTVSIPAISQRVIYYRVKYRDASNLVKSVSAPYAVAVP